MNKVLLAFNESWLLVKAMAVVILFMCWFVSGVCLYLKVKGYQ
jgi:hypothetical protein